MWGRRLTLGTAAWVAAFLLLGLHPLFLLGPLALLLLFSRPQTVREWMWIGLSLAGSAWLMAGLDQVGMPGRLLSAGAVMTSGLFVLVVVALPNATTFHRAAIAVTVATIGVVGWSLAVGVDIGAFDEAIAAEFRRGFAQLAEGVRAEQIEATIPRITRIYPSYAALQAVAGLAISWRLYQVVARTPLRPPPRMLRQFRFNDHLIWGAIFTLGVALLPLREPFSRVAVIVLAFWVGIYAARGLAVALHFLASWPLPGKLFLFVVSLLVLPIPLGASVAIGLADTWLDFRNRAVPTAGGGHADGSNSP